MTEEINTEQGREIRTCSCGYIGPVRIVSPNCLIHGTPPEQRCTCGSEGPDEFGNYDQLEDPDCPIHGTVHTDPLQEREDTGEDDG